MREPVGSVPPLGYDRMQQEHANVAHHAKEGVTSGRDRKTFSLATMRTPLHCEGPSREHGVASSARPDAREISPERLHIK